MHHNVYVKNEQQHERALAKSKELSSASCPDRAKMHFLSPGGGLCSKKLLLLG